MKQPKKNKRVLIADDDDTIRCLLCNALTDSGYSVNCVSTGRDLYNLSLSASNGSNSYDLMIVDVNMPDWKGTEGIEMASCFGAVQCPVIIISGTNTEEMVEDVKKMGHVFLGKPFRMTDLLDKVVELIGE